MLNGMSKIIWPHGKRFAFTIVDDTDLATVQNVGPVYDFLYQCGFLTTKTVWPLSPQGKPSGGGDSLQEREYRNWVLDLKTKGFEIALHGISDESSARPRIIEGLKGFKDVIGDCPQLHTNHTGQAECIYWGEDRFDGAMRMVYKFARKHVLKGAAKYYGQEEDSAYFWGDLCQEKITFVRNLIFNDINTLKVDPLMPYHDPRRKYVRYWFSSSAALKVNEFCQLLSEANQDQLVEEGGACVVYTHLAFDFFKDGKLNSRFVELMSRLSRLSGWFVPASTLLEYVGEKRGWQDVSSNKQIFSRMQWRWLMEKIKRGDEGDPVPVRVDSSPF